MNLTLLQPVFLCTLKVCFVLVLLFSASHVWAASLSLNPATGVYSSGQTFSVRVLVNTSGANINAADGTIKFNPNELSVVSISKGTTFNLWTAEPAFSNTAGTISFSGGTPTGYKGAAGTVITITFRTKGSGTSRVNFTSGSVLAADGMGTNVLTTMGSGSYTISAATTEPTPEVIIEYVPPANTPAAPVIQSVTHPDPQAWSKATQAELSWTVPAGVTSVRTLLDGSPSSIPTKIYDTPISSITLDELDEGIQYFHIQFRNADGWGRVAHYRLAVDSVAPTDLVLSLPDDAALSNPNQHIVFTATEETSGISRFKIQLDGGEPFNYAIESGSSTIALPALSPGYHTVIAEAFDEAGNSVVGTLSFTILAFDKPQFTEYPSEINEEVIPVIKGQTRPNAAVSVTVKRLGGNGGEQNYSLTSNQNGIFTLIPEGTFELGVYELSAVATDQFGAQSEPSDPIRIAVQKPGYLQLGSLVVSILSVFVPLLALVGLLGFGVWYLIFVLRRTRQSVGKETKEALTMLAKEFDGLQASLITHRDALAAARKTKKLTKAESTVLERISSDLKSARERVRKEISDVEDIVD